MSADCTATSLCFVCWFAGQLAAGSGFWQPARVLYSERSREYFGHLSGTVASQQNSAAVASVHPHTLFCKYDCVGCVVVLYMCCGVVKGVKSSHTHRVVRAMNSARGSWSWRHTRATAICQGAICERCERTHGLEHSCLPVRGPSNNCSGEQYR